MDRNHINRQGRPYNRTCGMMRASASMPAGGRRPRTGNGAAASDTGCACTLPGASAENLKLLSQVQGLPNAMAYVPCQKFSDTFDLSYAYRAGTIFPALCKPFCGKGRCCR